MLIFLILPTALIILIVSWYVKYYKYEKFLKRVPGPTPLPILGNILLFTSAQDFLTTNFKLHQKYGSIVKLRIGFRNPTLLIIDVKVIEHILGSTEILDKGMMYNFFTNWLGRGLLTGGGKRWKKHRKLLTPAFHFSILEQFVPILHSFAKILIRKLEKEIGNDFFDVYPYITLFSLDVICATSMGTNINAQIRSDSVYINKVKEMCEIQIKKIFSPIKAIPLLYSFTEDYKREKAALDILHGLTNFVISSRKSELNSKKENELEVDDMGIKKKLTLLDLLLENGINNKNDITDEEIREEIDTFMFAGHDTTACGISFTLYCLANHLDVQEKAMEELETIFSDDPTRNITYRDLQKMKYLEMTIKESLRLYPPVSTYTRYVGKDIRYNDLIIPVGTNIVISAFGLHRSPLIYPEPERFDPERFALEEQTKRSPYSYITFSAGPRNCLGQRFAMLEMKYVIATILQKFELLPSVPQHVPKLLGHVVLKSKNGICIRLKKRINK